MRFVNALATASWIRNVGLLVAAVCFAATRADAQPIVVTNSAEFISAIEFVNANPTTDHIIEIVGTITMTGQVQAIYINAELTVIGTTPTSTINGNGDYRPFFIADGAVSIENLTLINGSAAGGNGGGGAGGGLGAGAAVFVDSSGELRLKNVNFLGNVAQGGLGGANSIGGGGGGGLGGNGGNSASVGGGGGGGLYGAGGSTTVTGTGGGGGGGQLQSGGNSDDANGGGGGGTLTAGGLSSGGGLGGDGGGGGGTAGGNGSEGTTGRGVGGAEPGGNGGDGEQYGGGGGGAASGGSGGDGGYFGGGGGTFTGTGGTGGLMGGGGGAGILNGGFGGFGGGGGGAMGDYLGTAGTPGQSLFGGGDGGNAGGTADFGGGGGGAGFGGAVFAAPGAYIYIEDEVTFSANTATGGGSAGDGGTGASDGNDLYLMSGTITEFDISSGKSLTFTPAIGNNDGINAGVGIIKSGEGTLVLTGTSNFVGGTMVDDGTLIVDGVLSGTTNFVSGGSLVINGAMSGETVALFGNITVNSGGTLNGDTASLAGTVNLNGVINGDVDIDQFAVLTGNGTVNVSGNYTGALEVYGVIAPGNSIGTLTVNGNYLQGFDSLYEVEVNDLGQSDKINVTGTADLTCGCGPTPTDGGDVHVIAAPGNYAGRRVYTILTAAGGIQYRFDDPTWEGLNPYVNVLLEYDANNVYLIISQFDLMTASQTFNQFNTGTALNNQILTTDPQLQSIFTAMTTMNDAELRYALDQMSGELYGTLASVGFQCTDNWLGTIGNRLRPNGGAAQSFGLIGADGRARDAADDPFAQDDGDLFQLVSFEESENALTENSLTNASIYNASSNTSRRARTQHYGWVGGYGLGGDVTGNGNAQGFNYGYGGTSFGVDRYVGGNTIVGLAGGYAASRVHTDNFQQSAQVDSLQGAIYATRVVESRYLYGVFGYSHDAYDTTRYLPVDLTANGDFDGYQLSGYVESGLMRRWGAWNWQPSLGLQYINLHQDAFTETGAGGAGLAVDAANEDSCRGSVGLRFTRPTPVGRMIVIPTLQARYAHEFCNVDRFVTANFAGIVGSTFTTAGNQLGRDFGQYGVGLNTIVTRNIGTYLGYDLVTADRAVSHSGNGGLQFVWKPASAVYPLRGFNPFETAHPAILARPCATTKPPAFPGSKRCGALRRANRGPRPPRSFPIRNRARCAVSTSRKS